MTTLYLESSNINEIISDSNELLSNNLIDIRDPMFITLYNNLIVASIPLLQNTTKFTNMFKSEDSTNKRFTEVWAVSGDKFIYDYTLQKKFKII